MLEYLQNIAHFLTSGIYDFFTAAFASLIEWLVLGTLDFYIWAIQFAWGIAQNILTDLNISGQLNSAFAFLPANVADKVRYFRIPECIMNILGALTTRFVLRFIPGL